MSRCISRYTNEKHAQYFANGFNKFYLELRCDDLCKDGLNVCDRCSKITNGPVVQYFRTYNHGNVNEPIPDRSHIYGGKWFYERAKKYGMPSAEIIELAISYQREARGDFVVVQPDYEVNDIEAKDIKHNKIEIMPRVKKTDTSIIKTEIIDNAKKQILPLSQTIENNKPKRGRCKPQIDNIEITPEVDTIINTKSKEVKVSKKSTTVKTKTDAKSFVATGGVGRKSKKIEANPYSSLINSTTTMIHKEVTLPEYLETNLEEFDTDGYEIEYVKLSEFEHNSVLYFRDSKKNKLYKRIKDNAIGEYIGRYNSDTDSIIRDIPDSDDEE